MMTIKKLLTICFAIAIVAVVAWLFYRYPSWTDISNVSSGRLSEEQETAESAVGGGEEGIEELLEESPKIQKIVQLGQAANRRIDFYGLIVDQFGEPVPDALVNYQIPTYGEGLGPTVRNLSSRTGSDGRFAIEGELGVEIAMKSIEKDGYIFEKMRGKNYYYFPRTVIDKAFEPEPKNPITFHAWKKVEAARELKIGVGFWRVKNDSEYHALPIPQTDKTIQIRFEQNAEGDWANPLDWSVHIKVASGGVVPTDDTFMYEAPESGYQPEWSWYARKHGERWPIDAQQNFYFRAGDGSVYGRMEVHFIPYYGEKNQGVIDVKYWLNSTGSRNLLPADE